MNRVNTALGGPAGWFLVLLSISVLTVTFERIRFWVLWWQRRKSTQHHWSETVRLGGNSPMAWIEDRDLEMRFGEPFLESMTVIAPLVGLIGTVLALRRLLLLLGPQLILPSKGDQMGLGDMLTSTAIGLLVSLLAMVTLRLNMALRQWQLSIWRRDLHQQTSQLETP